MSILSSGPVLGIDIAKKTFQCALLREGKYQHKTFINTQKGYEALSQWLAHYDVTTCRVCLEATGVYGEGLARYLVEQQCTVSVVNPAKIKGFAQCQLQRLKTDKADAKLIAQYCQAMNPPAWAPEPLAIRQLQALVKRVDDVGNTLRQEQNRLRVADPMVQPSLRQSIREFEGQIQSLRQQIQAHIDQHPDLRARADLLNSIPGIGEVTNAQILAFIGNTDRFETVKQYVAFVGLNPKPCTSGTSVYKKTRLSKMGSASLRKSLYMPALVAMRYNPILQGFAERLKQAGKQGKVLVCAVMRKLVHIIYGVLKSGQPFKVPELSA